MTALIETYNDITVNPVTRMDHGLYSFSALPERKPLVWPHGASVALAVVINVDYGALATSPVNLVGYTYRDYGARVGVFRLMRILSDLGIRATLAISDPLLTAAPAVISAARAEGWEIIGHGADVTRPITSAMSGDEERAVLQGSRDAIFAATGRMPRGWLGPAGSQSGRTTQLLAELGYDYTLDWGNDEQPFDFIVPEGRLCAIPYSADTSDVAVVQAQSHTPWEFEEALNDHLDTLIAEGSKTGRVMTLGLQAHVSGQPLRAKYIRAFLERAVASGKVWCVTASQISDAYRAQK